MNRAILLASVAALALSAAAQAQTRDDQIGSVAALNSNVDGTPPAAATRQLFIGEGLVQNELIESSPIGSGQFLFLDQTTLTIARDSSLVLDKYVYNPDTKTGEFSMRMSRGVLRFIGGRITKNTDAVVVTPTATIGIRGGMAIITVDPDGTTRAQHIAGEYTRITTSNGEELFISRNNGMAEIIAGFGFGANAGGGSDGATGSGAQTGGGEDNVAGSDPQRQSGPRITYLGVADREYVADVTRQLIGRGQAGERRKPQDPDVVASGIVVRNFGAKDVLAEYPISTSGEKAEDDDQDDEIFIVRNEEEVQFVRGIEVLPDPPEPLAGVTGSAALDVTGVDGLTTGGGPIFVFEQVFEGSRIGVTALDERFSVPGEELGAFSFDFGGGESLRGPIGGNGFFDPNREFLYAAIRTEGGAIGYFLTGRPSGALPDAPAGQTRARSYELAPDLFTDAAPFLPSNVQTASVGAGGDLLLISNEGAGAAGGDAKALYGFLQIDGAGPGQTSGLGVLTGDVTEASTGTPEIASFFEGAFTDGAGGSSFVTSAVATVDDGQGGTAFGPRGRYLALSNRGDFGNGVETLVGSAVNETGDSTLFGGATYGARTGAVDADALTRGSLGATVLNGYAAINSPDSGGYSARNQLTDDVEIVLDITGNSLSSSLNLDAVLDDGVGGAPTSITAAFGGDGGASALVDDQTFGARGAATGGAIQGVDATTSGAFVTAGLVGDGGVFPQGTDTTPAHLTWGWWASSLDGGVAGTPEQNLHLGAWVAGDVTASTNLPTTGVATYEGFAAVSGVENGQTFVDGASFALTYEFGNGGLGTVQFNDLLGDNPIVAVSGVGTGGNYSGVAGVTANGRAGLIAIDGAFFNADGAPAGATAGGIDIVSNDQALRASGVFGGDRTGN